MQGRIRACIASAALLTALALAPVRGDDWPFRWKAEPDLPNTLTQIARSIDCIEYKILDDGVVVIKQPDVWGQSRMTLYRKDFEAMMKASGPNDFKEVLSARIARLDQASVESQTALGASLGGPAPAAGGSRGRSSRSAPAQSSGTAGHGAASAVTAPTVIALQPSSSPSGKAAQSSSPSSSSGSGGDSGGSGSPGGSGGGGSSDPYSNAADLLKTPLPTFDEPFALLTSKGAFQKLDDKLGLEPTIFLEEKKRYFDHLNEIRRVNIGDDNADSAGYGLYLIRMPVSIQPGELTLKGHGALLTVTARHEFDPTFLKNTFHNLVVNDLVDQLAPIVYELIRNGVIEKLEDDRADLAKKREEYFNQQMEYARVYAELKEIRNDLNKSRTDVGSLQIEVQTYEQTLKPALTESLTKSLTDPLQPMVTSVLNYGQKIHIAFEEARTQASKSIASGAAYQEAMSEAQSYNKIGLDRVLDVKKSLTSLTRSDDELAFGIKLVASDLAKIEATLRRPPTGPSSSTLLHENKQSPGSDLLGTVQATVSQAPGAVGSGPAAGAPPAASAPDPRVDVNASQSNQLDFERGQYEKAIKAQVDELRKHIDTLEPRWERFVKDDVTNFFKAFDPNTLQQAVGDATGDAFVDSLHARVETFVANYRIIYKDISIKVKPDLEQYVQTLSKMTQKKQNIDLLTKKLSQLAEMMDRSLSAVKSQGTDVSSLQSSVFIEQVAARAFPSTRFGVRTYPVAPSDIDDVFLTKGIQTIVRKTRESLPTEVPRATDVRNFIRHEIEAAYDLLDQYQSDVDSIAMLIESRNYTKLKNQAFPMLVAKLPGDLRGQLAEELSILSWWVAIEAGLLDRQLKKDMKATAELNGNRVAQQFVCPDLSSLRFYERTPSPEAEDAFAHYVRARWPMIVFALDPAVDQQNIADALSLRRDLQLALAFSFATGKINFSQLDRYNHKIEQDSETIALNRTVTSFSHGNEVFGWRFYPRYQNPPPEPSNLHTIANTLIRNGLGRNYQMKNSKLEAGLRELTAVIIMPSFLERVRFDVTGNWFPLHDPDVMEVPTARMLEQGRKVVELRRSLETAAECESYRPEDLDRLRSRVDQLEAMLPMQTRRVNVPYENTLGGFQLFTPGSTALVPEVTGFEGVESVEEGASTDIVVFGKHFSLHETKVVVGGKVLVPNDVTPATTKSLAGTQVNIVSREVMHLKLPQDVRPTQIKNVADKTLAKKDDSFKPKPYVELYIATPNGISNRLLIPYKSKAKAAAPMAEPSADVEAGYVLLDDTLKIQARITPQQGGTAKKTDTAAQPNTLTIKLESPQFDASKSTTDVKQKTAAATDQQGQTQKDSTASSPSATTDQTKAGAKPANAAGQAQNYDLKIVPYNKWDQIRIMPTQPPANSTDSVDVEFRFPVEYDVFLSVSASGVPFKVGSYVISHDAMTRLATDFLQKLNAYGKLIDQTRGTEIVSKSVLITVKGSNKAPKATHNPMKVSILLFAEPAAPTADATNPADDSSSTNASRSLAPTGPTSYRLPSHDAQIPVDAGLVPAEFVPRPPVSGLPALASGEFPALPPQSQTSAAPAARQRAVFCHSTSSGLESPTAPVASHKLQFRRNEIPASAPGSAVVDLAHHR